MMNNTEITADGVEVYLHKIFELADEYITNQLNGDREQVSKYFRDMIFYISDRLERIPNDDITALDNLFMAYVRLCSRFGKLPTLECFSWLCKVHRGTFWDWKSGQYRLSTSHADTVEKWLSICRGFVVDELSNNSYANPNLIFIGKAAYNLRETAPVPVQNPHQIASRTPEEIAASYGITEIKSDMEFPEPPDL